MSILGIFDIAKTALFTTRKSLDTIANNVANASTPGYTRQEVVLDSIPSGMVSTTGDSGRGVRVSEVKRLYDSFVNLQLRTETSNSSYWDAYEKGVVKIEDLFNEANDNGMGPAITDFLNAWTDVAQNPEGYAQRTLLMKKADYLSSLISRSYTTLNDERSEIYKNSKSLTDEVNSLTPQIADLNSKIASSPGSLDLYDKRDEMLQKLNNIFKVNYFEDNSHMYTVLLGGTPLVDGGKSFSMNVANNSDNKLSFFVNIKDVFGNVLEQRDISSLITGGEMKANIDLRDSKINSYMNKINALSISLTEMVNSYHKNGYGLDNSTGNNFFTDVNPPYLTKDSNVAGGATIADTNVSISDLNRVNFEKQYKMNYVDNVTYGNLTPSERADYQREGATNIYWRVQEATDGTNWSTVNPATVNIDTASVAPDRVLNFQGLSVRINGAAGGLPPAGSIGEDFTINPNPNAALEMKVAITDVNKVAAALGDMNTTFSITSGLNDKIKVAGIALPVSLAPPASLPALPGPYTRFELASILQNTLNQAGVLGAGATTVTFDAQSNKFRITNNTGGAVTINWTAQGTTGEDIFGFTTDTTIQPGSFAESNNEIKSGSLVVDSTNNSIRFSEDGGSTYVTATVAKGTYTRKELETALENALKGASTGFTYSVTYNSNTRKYTILNNGANPNKIILDWSNPLSTAKELFGFHASSIISTAGGSATSDSAVYPVLPSDNRNAKLIADILGQQIVAGASPTDYYRQIVSDIGVESQSAKQSQKFSSTLVGELSSRREQLSGVSLDEEAANLVKYQKSYEAAAKMISMAEELLTTIINMTGK